MWLRRACAWLHLRESSECFVWCASSLQQSVSLRLRVDARCRSCLAQRGSLSSWGLECEQPRGCGLLACGSWGSAACCGLVGLVPRFRLAACLLAAWRTGLALRGPIGLPASEMGWPSGLGPCVRGRCKVRRSVMPTRRRGSGPGGANRLVRNAWVCVHGSYER